MVGNGRRLNKSDYLYIGLRTVALLFILLACIACLMETEWWGTGSALAAFILGLLTGVVYALAISQFFAVETGNNLGKKITMMSIGALGALITAILFVVATNACWQWYYNQCVETHYTYALRFAAAFAFLSLLFAGIDLVISCLQHFRQIQQDQQVQQQPRRQSQEQPIKEVYPIPVQHEQPHHHHLRSALRSPTPMSNSSTIEAVSNPSPTSEYERYARIATITQSRRMAPVVSEV